MNPTAARRTLTITPAGVIGTIALALVVAVFVRLGFWQLDRLGERRALNAAVASRLDAAPIDHVGALGDTAGVIYRVFTARGEYDDERSIILPGRSHRGVPGVHLLTPLRLEGRPDAVLVNRGWIPSADAAHVTLDEFRVDSSVTVRGLVLPFPGAAASLAPPDRASPPAGFRRIWYNVHEPTLRAQFPYPLLAASVQELPAEGAARYPVRLDPPALDEGPHLGYALQWFSFALIGVIGWVALVLRQRAPARVAPPPAAVAALFLLLAGRAEAQLRPLDPMAWDVYEPQTFMVASAGVGALWHQPATLAGTRGRLLELGNYNVTVRFDRIAIELAGTAFWRLTEQAIVSPPASWVEPPDGSARQDVGLASAATLINVTPERSPVDVVIRFGARIPTTSDETGLERDRTDFFALAGLRYETGPFAFAAENGVGIYGTTYAEYPQSDVWTYAFGAEYREGGLFGSAQLVGHEDGRRRRVQRGNEDLRELRLAAGVGDEQWLGITYIRGLSAFSPRHGLRLTAGFRVPPLF